MTTVLISSRDIMLINVLDPLCMCGAFGGAEAAVIRGIQPNHCQCDRYMASGSVAHNAMVTATQSSTVRRT